MEEASVLGAGDSHELLEMVQRSLRKKFPKGAEAKLPTVEEWGQSLLDALRTFEENSDVYFNNSISLQAREESFHNDMSCLCSRMGELVQVLISKIQVYLCMVYREAAAKTNQARTDEFVKLRNQVAAAEEQSRKSRNKIQKLQNEKTAMERRLREWEARYKRLEVEHQNSAGFREAQSRPQSGAGNPREAEELQDTSEKRAAPVAMTITTTNPLSRHQASQQQKQQQQQQQQPLSYTTENGEVLHFSPLRGRRPSDSVDSNNHFAALPPPSIADPKTGKAPPESAGGRDSPAPADPGPDNLFVSKFGEEKAAPSTAAPVSNQRRPAEVVEPVALPQQRGDQPAGTGSAAPPPEGQHPPTIQEKQVPSSTLPAPADLPSLQCDESAQKEPVPSVDVISNVGGQQQHTQPQPQQQEEGEQQQQLQKQKQRQKQQQQQKHRQEEDVKQQRPQQGQQQQQKQLQEQPQKVVGEKTAAVVKHDPTPEKRERQPDAGSAGKEKGTVVEASREKTPKKDGDPFSNPLHNLQRPRSKSSVASVDTVTLVPAMEAYSEFRRSLSRSGESTSPRDASPIADRRTQSLRELGATAGRVRSGSMAAMGVLSGPVNEPPRRGKGPIPVITASSARRSSLKATAGVNPALSALESEKGSPTSTISPVSPSSPGSQSSSLVPRLDLSSTTSQQQPTSTPAQEARTRAVKIADSSTEDPERSVTPDRAAIRAKLFERVREKQQRKGL